MIRTSVIIPVYNTAAYLRECIESVLDQTQQDIEIILVDDGSDDGSLEIEEEYADKHSFIRLLRQDHEYQGTARNRGLETAQGEFVYFMDSDDAIKPELFEKCYRECCDRDLDFVMFDAQGFRYDENDRELAVPDDIIDRRRMGIGRKLYTGPEFWNRFYNDHGILYVCWLLYIRRSYLTEHDLYYEERTYFEDNDWMLRMYLHAKRISYIPEILHRHRWRRGSNMLDGFTVGLMKGCFRMHEVLLDIRSRYEDDAVRSHMTSDVISLNLHRFDRLAEIEPTDEYKGPLLAFCSELREKLAQTLEESFEHMVHTAAVERILRAAKIWKEPAFDPYEELAVGYRYLPVPALSDGSRLGIYGSGKAGKYYVQALQKSFDTVPGTVFFIDSGKDGGTCCGYPIVIVGRLKEMRPDNVVIASTKYAEEMEASVRQEYDDCRIIRLPEAVRFFL